MSVTDVNGPNGKLTAAALIEELEDCQPNALVVIWQNGVAYGVSAVEIHGATVRLHVAGR